MTSVHHLRLRIASIALAILAAATACNSPAAAGRPAIGPTASTPGQGGPGPTEADGAACGLVTTAQAGAILGVQVTATEQDQGVVQTCRYRGAAATDGSVYVSLLSASAPDFDTAAANLPVAHTSISGVGDKAVLAAGAGELITLSGSHMVSVIVVHKGVVFGTEAELRSLAVAALHHL